MINLCRRISENERFQTFILFLIILTALSMGMETVPDMAEQFEFIFNALFYFTQAAFAFEIFVRLMAHAPSFGSFFRRKSNTFDFVIVAASFVPGIGSFALVARILRVLRVFSVSDRLRTFFDRLKNSFDEAAYASLIVLIMGYIFAISGFYLFSTLDPDHWGTLGKCAISVFYLMLLQDIPSYIAPLIQLSIGYIFYFLVFYFVFISLFVSVIVAAVLDDKNDGKNGESDAA